MVGLSGQMNGIGADNEQDLHLIRGDECNDPLFIIDRTMCSVNVTF